MPRRASPRRHVRPRGAGAGRGGGVLRHPAAERLRGAAARCAAACATRLAAACRRCACGCSGQPRRLRGRPAASRPRRHRRGVVPAAGGRLACASRFAAAAPRRGAGRRTAAPRRRQRAVLQRCVAARAARALRAAAERRSRVAPQARCLAEASPCPTAAPTPKRCCALYLQASQRCRRCCRRCAALGRWRIFTRRQPRSGSAATCWADAGVHI